MLPSMNEPLRVRHQTRTDCSPVARPAKVVAVTTAESLQDHPSGGLPDMQLCMDAKEAAVHILLQQQLQMHM
jgi:hypothetical protein